MQVKFFTKENLPEPISQVIELSKFLLSNKQYIEITLKIISQIKTSIYNVDIIEKLTNNRLLKVNVSFNEKIKQKYIEIMFNIYKNPINELGKIRGDILEIISSSMVLCNTCKDNLEWIIIPEAKVMIGEEEFSQKDMDLVFKHCEIDMLECKCNVHNFLRDPPSKNTKDKLKFMDRVRELSNKEIKTTVYLVTAQTNEEPSRNMLNRLGYTHFKIFKAQDIIRYI